MEQATRGASDATKQMIKNANGNTIALDKMTLGAKAASVGLKALSIAGNMLMFWAITEGIQLAIKALDKLILTTEEAKEALDNSVSSFQGTTDELNNLESELETTSDRLRELQKLAENNTISIAEERELELLKQQNDELERKIALKKEEQVDAAKQVLKDAKKYSDKEVMSSYAYVSGTYEQGAPQYDSISAADELSIAFDKYYSSTNRPSANQQNPKDVIENMYAVIEPTIEAYEALIDADYKLSNEEQTHYDKLRSLQDRYLQYRYDLNGLKETYQALSVEQQKNILLNKLTAQGLSDIQANAVLDSVSESDYASLWEKGFSFTPPQMTDYATAEEYGKAYANAWLNGVKSGIGSGNETDILSFSDAWNSEDFEDARKELLSLAEAGQLTPETLESTEQYKTLLEQTGLSAEEVAKKINSMTDASTQLQSMSAQISKMSDMLADKKNGTVASASDLAGFDATVKGLESWAEFERVMGSSKSSMEECQAAADALATEWVNNGNYLANLTDENKDYYITQLNNMGIENADAIVTNYLTQKKQALALATEFATAKGKDLSNATFEEINAFIEENKIAGEARNALYRLALAKQGVNAATLSFDGDITNIKNYVKALGGAAYALSMMEQIKNNPSASIPSEARNQILKQAQIEVETVTNTPADVGLSDLGSFGYKPSGGSSKSGGSGSGSDTKQTIDWIERLLDVLQKKIDQTKAKFENLFTLKDKKNNLTEQLSLTKTLLTATEKSAKRYKKAADKVKLSDKLKTKVQNGDYDISEYDSETADAINKYKEYYDQYLSLLQEEEVLRKDIRDIEIEGYQLDIDHAEALIAKSQALAALQEGNYKEQNKRLEGQKKYLREQYEAQIKIAEAEGNTLEVERLRSELLKELRDKTKEQFDNINATYSMKIGFTDNKVKAFQDQISLLEAQGQQIGSRLYTKQMELNQLNINKLNTERRKQIKKVDKFGVGTKEWYEAQDAIFSTERALNQYEIEQANLQKSINQLKFDRFDDLLNKLNDIVDETDFLISMLDSDNFFDDNGNMTSDGVTAMGLTAQNYDTYLAQAEKYKQMLSDVKDMYDAGKISLEEYEEYQRKYSQSQRNAIKSANDAKKSIIDYVKQGLDAQNNALSEAINKQKELLQSEKDLKDFQDRLADSNKSIADIQKQINALESDNSESNRKKLQQLRSDLANAQKDQEDLLYDRSISDQEDALDQMLKNSQEQTENYLKDSEKVFVDALAYVNTHSMQVSNNLEQISKETGYDISENITNAWKDAGKAVDSYENILTGNVPNITSQISLITTAWQEACDAAEKASKAIVNATEGEYVEHTTEGADAKVLSDIEWYIQKNGVAPKNKPSSYSPLNQYIYEKTGKVIAEDKQAGLAKILGVTGIGADTSISERNKILKALKAAGFSSGGVIDAKHLIKSTGEDGLALVQHREGILKENQWELIRDLGNTLSNMNYPTYKSYIPDFQPRNVQSPVYHIDNSITVEGVATDKIVKDMEGVAKKQAENVVSKINNMAYAKGVRRR